MNCLAKRVFALNRNRLHPPTPYAFSVRANSSQNPNPIRIPFEQENLHYLNHVFSLKADKDALQRSHRQFLGFLSSEGSKGRASFETFSNSNKHLYDYIKRDILQEEGSESMDQFIQRSHYYFSSEGKKIRPTMVKMIAKSLPQGSPADEQKIEKWGALIEMMHISSLAHDDIIDDSPSRRGIESQHLRYGKRSALFSANYIIGKASKSIFDFKSAKLYQIYSAAMDNLATGEIIQAASKSALSVDLKHQISTYIHKTYYKTAALMANALRGVPVFFEQATAEQELACFRVGQHLGIAFQLVDDIIDYTSTTEEMGKQSLADIAEGNVTGPVFFTLLSQKQEGKTSDFSLKGLKVKKKSKEEATRIREWVFGGRGIELTFALADLHIKRALQFLEGFPSSNLQAWKYLAYVILQRKK